MSLSALGGAQLTARSSNPSDDSIVPLFVCLNHVSLALVQDAMQLSSWDVDTKHAFVTDYCLCQFPCATNLSVTLRSDWRRPRLGALPLSQVCTVPLCSKLESSTPFTPFATGTNSNTSLDHQSDWYHRHCHHYRW